MTLVARLWMLLGISVIGLLALGGKGYYGLNTMQNEVALIDEKETKGVYHFQNTALILANIQRAARNLLMLNEDNEKFKGYASRLKQKYSDLQEEFKLAAATMYSEKGRAINNEIAKNLEAYNNANQALLAEVTKLRELAQSRGNQPLSPNELVALYALAETQQGVFRELDKSILAGSELKIIRTKEAIGRLNNTSIPLSLLLL